MTHKFVSGGLSGETGAYIESFEILLKPYEVANEPVDELVPLRWRERGVRVEVLIRIGHEPCEGEVEERLDRPVSAQGVWGGVGQTEVGPVRKCPVGDSDVVGRIAPAAEAAYGI